MPRVGFSLGASRGTTMNSLGIAQGIAVLALPFGEVATGAAFIGSSDPITGFSLNRIFNWGATVVSEPEFTLSNPLAGHDMLTYSNAAGIHQ